MIELKVSKQVIKVASLEHRKPAPSKAVFSARCSPPFEALANQSPYLLKICRVYARLCEGVAVAEPRTPSPERVFGEAVATYVRKDT